MLYTNHSFSNALSQEQLYLVARARRQPLVMPLSGVAISRDLVLKQGQVKKKLFCGVLNYWFLRDWASFSLGEDCSEIVDVLPGRNVVYDPEVDMSSPSVCQAMGVTNVSRDSPVVPLVLPDLPDKVGLKGSEVSKNDLLGRVVCGPVRIAGVWFGPEPLKAQLSSRQRKLDNQIGRPSLQMQHSLYKLFSSGAYFLKTTFAQVLKTQMPFIGVPITPFEIVTGKPTYRRSQMDVVGEEQIFNDLMDGGYVYRVDETKTLVYYTNSVAVHSGYPPTAEAIGWPKLSLEPLPGDWLDRVVLEGGLRLA
jgi:hypothetical protein